MEEIKKKIDAFYNEAVQPLENHTGSTNRINGMMEYMTIFGDAVLQYAKDANEIYADVQKNDPDKKEETRKYLEKMKNKMIETYKPK